MRISPNYRAIFIPISYPPDKAVFFFCVKKTVTREILVQFWSFGHERKKMSVNKTEKPQKSNREYCFFPVKIFENLLEWNLK